MILRKTIFTLSFICYLAVTTGVTVNFHFCMDRLASVHLFESKADECGICGMDMHDGESTGCCSDEVKLAKLEQDENKFIPANYGIAAIEPLVILPSAFIETPFENIDVQRHFHNHSPPILSGQDIYLQNSVFRI